ncbi:hypothetical protein Vadar_020002 [Vaccinium darrowii]|uniref:Uncharacterized protein n=1 Tax=Vaccinium darrowii TaxID=229202 RepID=A0ACB7ZL91_9ERIC|nr:hypothetical protein Vadar_020002 [Vaccinium darrowii]
MPGTHHLLQSKPASPAPLAKHQNRGMVSDSDLADRLRQLLRTSDLRTTTATAVRRILEEEYGVDLSGRKAFIRRQIELFIDERAAENDGVYDVAEPVVAEEGAENVTNDKIGCEEDGGVREQVGEWGGKRRRKGRSDKVANAVKKKDRGFMKSMWSFSTA